MQLNRTKRHWTLHLTSKEFATFCAALDLAASSVPYHISNAYSDVVPLKRALDRVIAQQADGDSRYDRKREARMLKKKNKQKA